jgi:predicted permease
MWILRKVESWLPWRRRQTREADLERELRDYLDLEREEQQSAGLSQEDAAYTARRTLGNVARIKEDVRMAWGHQWLETLLRDFHYDMRQLRRSPGFTTAAVLTLALGIGTTTALFTVVRSVLLKPLPFREPDRLIRLYEYSSDSKFPYNMSAGGVFAEWKKQSRGFSDLAILTFHDYDLSGTGGQLPEKVRAAEVSGNLFSTLGVEPVLGRGFAAADDRRSASATVILGWGLWKRRFGADPYVLKQSIKLDGKSYSVIGIMPAWFAYPAPSVQLWTPIYHEEAPDYIQAIDDHGFRVVGRLKPGATEKQATAELSVITRRLHDQHLDDPFVSKAANSKPLLEDLVGDIRTPMYVLLAATACLLLIACLNVASLLVARGATRRRELAIRTALGGGRWRLVGERLTESLVLSAGGGSVGLLVTFAVLRWFIAKRPYMGRVEAIHPDVMVTAFVFGLVFACAILSCLASSLSAGGAVLTSLHESSRSQSAGHARVVLRKSLVMVEVSLTAVLLIGAGLLLRSYERLRSSDLGCITKDVLTMRLSLPEVKYGGVQRVNFFEALLERLRSLPSVDAAGLVRVLPGQGYGGDSGFSVAEHPPLPAGKAQYAMVRWADPGYFAALGIPLLRGQTFDENQRLEKAQQVVISESFARVYFPGENPIGKHLLTIGRRSFRVVGVVGDTRYVASKPAQPIMYFPLYAFLYGGVPNEVAIGVRSAHNVTSLALPIQRIVHDLDPELALADILTMDQVIGKSTLDASFDATVLLTFALLSLTLAAVGLFGVLSYIVTQRTRELGIRMALGAQQGDVFRSVLGQGIVPALLGLCVGVIGASALARFLASLLYGVKPTDPMTFAGVSLILIVVALLACYAPASRAANVDPMVALRCE